MGRGIFLPFTTNRIMAAADFYFAINATFRFILNRYGEQALYDYWQAMGQDYYAPLAVRFREGGLDAAADYWRAFFDAEPGGDVSITWHTQEVEILVHDCPAIAWLRAHGREIVPQYCAHCQHVSAVVAENAGLGFAMEGGGGQCVQRFTCSANSSTLADSRSVGSVGSDRSDGSIRFPSSAGGSP